MYTKKKLNIALVCDSIEYIRGGSFESGRRFSTELIKRGHKIFLITCRHKFATNLFPEFKYNDIFRGPSLIPYGPDKFIASVPSEKSIKKYLIDNKIDIAYLLMPFYSSLVVATVAHKIGIPVVTHCHVQAENAIGVSKLFLSVKIPISYYIKHFHDKSDLTICPSKFAEDNLLKERLKSPTKIISNGVDLKRFTVLKGKDIKYVFKKYSIKEGKFNLVLFSRLSPEKSIITAIKALQLIIKTYPNLQMIIIGGGPEYSKLNRLTKRLKLSNNVVFCGRAPDEDIVPLLNIGNIFIHPSFVELEGMVVLEAMACGLPLIVSDAKSSASSSLIEGNGLTFKNKKVVDLTKKIRFLISKPVLLSKMRNSSLTLSKKYDINISINNLENAFFSLIK